MEHLNVSTTAGERVALLKRARPERMNALSSRRRGHRRTAAGDRAAGMSAFLAKRQPTFEGR
jgi:enoyl-CoA hydratase/carnithine racemase